MQQLYLIRESAKILLEQAYLNLLMKILGSSSSKSTKMRFNLHFSLVFSQKASNLSVLGRYFITLTLLQQQRPSLSFQSPWAPTPQKTQAFTFVLWKFCSPDETASDLSQSPGFFVSYSLSSYASRGNQPPTAFSGFLNSIPYKCFIMLLFFTSPKRSSSTLNLEKSICSSSIFFFLPYNFYGSV